MTLTTGAPPAAGYNGIGLIFTQFVANLEPDLTMRLIPTGALKLSLSPRLLMMGPQSAINYLSPKLIMRGGTVASSSFTVKLAPTLVMGNGTSATTAFTVTLTPHLTMAATFIPSAPRGHVYGQAVQRAATI